MKKIQSCHVVNFASEDVLTCIYNAQRFVTDIMYLYIFCALIFDLDVIFPVLVRAYPLTGGTNITEIFLCHVFVFSRKPYAFELETNLKTL